MLDDTSEQTRRPFIGVVVLGWCDVASGVSGRAGAPTA